MKKQEKNLLKMKQLCELSGVTRTTIKYYLAKGLLPEPIKSSRNMAYYNETHLNAIRIIKELQTKRFFPLSVIQDILGKKDGDLTIEEKRVLAEADGKFFIATENERKFGPLTTKQLHELTGVSLKEIREMENKGVIHSFQEGNKKYFKDDNVRLVACWAEIRSIGFSAKLGFNTSVMNLYKEFSDRLTDEEAKIVLKLFAGKISPQQMVRMIEKVVVPLSITLDIFHRKSIVETTAKYAEQFRKLSPENLRVRQSRINNQFNGS
ncbi:MAG: MerR family transcriptional regulator [Syntrophales bacterium]